MDCKLIVFGTGVYGKKAADYFGSDSIVAFSDNMATKWGETFYGKKIVSPDTLYKYENIRIIIAVESIEAQVKISEQLLSMNIYNYEFFVDIINNDEQVESIERRCLKKISNYYNNQICLLNRRLDYLFKHIDICDLKPAVGFLRKKQIEIMQFVEEIMIDLEDLNISPFLIGGNLIGWIRHGGFVPWDDDIDFGIMRSDLEILKNYAENNWIVKECEVFDSEQQEWIDSVTHESDGQIIFFIYAEHVQISKGTNCINRKSVDFFVYDYFSENASFEEHNKYIGEIYQDYVKCNNEKKRIELVKNAKNNDRLVCKKSNHIYFGDDSCEPYLRQFNKNWIDYNVVFPLKTICYEGVNLSIPNRPKDFIVYEYPNYMDFPNDFGIASHDYWRAYKKEFLKTVEFYLIDSFEIYHFIPFYSFLRDRGIYAIFIAEPQDINSTGKWFDYEKAIEILESKQLEYDTKCNPNADFAFTTQRVECLNKYHNSKINITYGCGLKKNQFGFSIDSIEGFDFKFVHGIFTKEICHRNLSEEKWNRYKDRIMMMGYPKYTASSIMLNKNELLKKLGVGISNKIIVYLPTWGAQSCIDVFYASMKDLKETYTVIIKPHHCTARLDSEINNRNMLNDIASIIVPAEYDTRELLEISDLVICNAESGVALECGYLNKSVNLLLITKEKNIDDLFFAESQDVARIVNKPEELDEAIKTTIKGDVYKEKRNRFEKEIFGVDSYNYLNEIYKTIFA